MPSQVNVFKLERFESSNRQRPEEIFQVLSEDELVAYHVLAKPFPKKSA